MPLVLSGALAHSVLSMALSNSHCPTGTLPQPLTDCRVVHRALNSYFDAYSPAQGRYIPSRKLQVWGQLGKLGRGMHGTRMGGGTRECTTTLRIWAAR